MRSIARVLLRLGLGIGVVLAVVGAPRSAAADPADAKPTAAGDAAGRAHFQRGQRLSASGQYAAAYREFAAGYAATKRPLFLFNMGEAARAGGDAAKACDAYLEFLRVDPKSALAATARTRLAELGRGAEPPTRPETTTVPAEPGGRPDAPAARPDASGGRPDASAARSDGTRAPEGPPGGSASIREGPRSEPIPLMPPSATRPQPAPDGLPPERFSAEHADAEDRPLWKKWPFWAVVGGVVAGGVVVFAVTRDHGTTCGPGCSEIDFRPPR